MRNRYSTAADFLQLSAAGARPRRACPASSAAPPPPRRSSSRPRGSTTPSSPAISSPSTRATTRPRASTSPIFPGGPDVIPESSLIAGKADLTLTTPDTTVSAIVDQGAKFKIIGTQYQKNPIGIVSLAKNPIKTPADLVGKTLAVPPVNVISVEAMLKLNNIDKAKVKIVPYEYDPTPLIKGEIDASLDFTTNVPYTIEQAGEKAVSFLLYDFGFTIYNDTVVVTEDTLKAKRKEIVAWLKASRKGWTDNLVDPAVWPPKFADTWFKGTGRTIDNEIYFNTAQKPLIEHPKGIFAMDEEGIAEEHRRAQPDRHQGDPRDVRHDAPRRGVGDARGALRRLHRRLQALPRAGSPARGPRPYLARLPARLVHRADRAVGLREVDAPAHRPRAREHRRGPRHDRRRGAGGGAQARRDRHRLPGSGTPPLALGQRQHRPAARRARRRPARGAGAHPAPRLAGRARPASRRRCPASSPAACASASRSPARW